MNPNNEASGMQLPPPVMEQPPAVGTTGEQSPESPEQATVGGERAPGPQFAAMAAPTSIPLPTQPIVSVTDPAAVASTTQPTAAMMADDGDLIEKEWVLKAKAIVDRNSEDPYKQSEELTAVKADYLKQRYNKVIKLNK